MGISAIASVLILAGGIIGVYTKLQVDLANVKKDIIKLTDLIEQRRLETSDLHRIKADQRDVDKLEERMLEMHRELINEIKGLRKEVIDIIKK